MLKRVMRELHDNPVKFVKEILQVTPDEWQAEALSALAKNPRVAIRSGHGVGKTALESFAILWFLFTRPFPKIPCTAPTSRQLFDVLWSEISKWLQRSPMLESLFEWRKTAIRLKAAPERWFATARTAVKPENLAGFHEHSILFVLDEASGIDDKIFEVIEGALTTPDAKLLICGNPTRNDGFFKRAFFEDRELFYTMKVSSADSPRVSSAYCQRLVKQYGADSDVVRVRVFGEFPKSSADGLIALETVEAAMAREPVHLGELVIGVDVARFGDDETVLVARLGNTVVGVEHYRKSDLMTTAGRIIQMLETHMKKFSKKQATINVDETGLGGGLVDRLREVAHENNLAVGVNGCNNGGKASDSHYANFGAESWFALRDRFVAEEIILPIRDDELIAQLTTRKYRLNSRGQFMLEPKDEYKKRCKRSPDRADALVLAFAPTVEAFAPPKFTLKTSYWR